MVSVTTCSFMNDDDDDEKKPEEYVYLQIEEVSKLEPPYSSI